MTRHADVTLSVHKTRRKARDQRADLLARIHDTVESVVSVPGANAVDELRAIRFVYGLPKYPVRLSVRKAGLRQWQVVAVERQR